MTECASLASRVLGDLCLAGDDGQAVGLAGPAKTALEPQADAKAYWGKIADVADPGGQRVLAQNALAVPELDHAIMAYLKLHPRAPHTVIGKAVGASAETVARSMDRMKRSGTLRVVAASNLAVDQMESILVAQISAKGPLNGLEDHIAAHAQAMSVYQCAGQFQLMALFQFDDMAQLARLADYIAKWPEPVGKICYSFALEVVKFDFIM